MPRIDADREVRHGLHTDYFWPGVIHSEWKWHGVVLRRERTYHDRNHRRLYKTAWQLHFGAARYRVGVRFEVDEPNFDSVA